MVPENLGKATNQLSNKISKTLHDAFWCGASVTRVY